MSNKSGANKIKYLYPILAAAVVILDQAAKLLVQKYISPTDCIHVIPGLFNLVFVKNTGAAFSILSDSTGLLGAISVLFCAGVAVYSVKKRPQNTLLCTTLTLLFAGALGNAIDRIFRGYVIDFISTAFITFPVFNVADIAITVGAVLLIIYLLLVDGKEENPKETAGESK